MIKIEKVIINNYRSFKNKDNQIEKLTNINVLVGKNNVGKTNFLRALYLFFNPDNYNAEIDRNEIKNKTGGGSKDPIIEVRFIDDELSDKPEKYTIICDLNKKIKERYRLKCKKEIENKILKSNSYSQSKNIENYLKNRIKCVFLSTTDEEIEVQSQKLLNDLILRYYKKKSKTVRNSIKKFEESYRDLKETFSSNIGEIESDLANQFVSLPSLDIIPKLEQSLEKDITSFLIENINLILDDAYAQGISTKGAGIQRISLILLTIFLLNNIFETENKYILLDEPEAFLYPLLEDELKNKLETSVLNQDTMQLFITTHSSTYLREINNSEYSFSYFTQVKEEKHYVRSKNDTDINKYTRIENMNRKNKYEVLKNYGLLDGIDDYEYIILCEGETDCNYIKKILEGKEFIPQIRYNQYVLESRKENSQFKHNYFSSGAGGILPILIYLNQASQVSRKVLVILDGDREGVGVSDKILEHEYDNLEIKKVVLPKGKEIEDVVFSKENFIKKVLSVEPSLDKFKDQFRNVIMNIPDNKSLIEQTEQFIAGNNISGANIKKIKPLLSQNLTKEEIEAEYLLSEIEPFFYQD